MEASLADEYLLPIVISVLSGCVVLAVVTWCVVGGSGRGKASGRVSSPSPEPDKASEEDEPPEEKSVDQEKKPKKAAKQFGRKHSYSHALLAANLKGHTGQIFDLDFDQKGKYLLSCSEDRSVRLWLPKTFSDKVVKFISVKVELDHGTHCCMSPDGKAFILTQENNQTVNIYKLTKKEDGKVLGQLSLEFPPKQHSSPIIAVAIASTGKFIMTCCEKKFLVWNLKGDVLADVVTYMTPNNYATVSPCGRFVLCTGFTADVKFWFVQFTKAGDYHQVTKSMQLTGHGSGIYHCSLSADSTRAATVSKDGSWKLWNIDVDFRRGEEPKLLLSQNLPVKGQSHIALSPDARTTAVAIERSIFLYGCSTGALLETMIDCHDATINSMCWSPDNEHLCSSGGKVIHVWHNQVALEETLRDLKKQLDSATSEAHKRRVLEKIKETEQTDNTGEELEEQ